MKIDRIIHYIRENMVANAPGTGGGFGVNSNAAGPVAGNTYKFFKKKRNRYIYPKNTRKNWM